MWKQSKRNCGKISLCDDDEHKLFIMRYVLCCYGGIHTVFFKSFCKLDEQTIYTNYMLSILCSILIYVWIDKVIQPSNFVDGQTIPLDRVLNWAK